jgi:hypothetical protein
MKSLTEILKIAFLFIVFLICGYIVGYPSLRLSNILIARNYFVYKSVEEGGQLVENHFDIDHGPAMVLGKQQPSTFIGIIYKPLSFIELYLRGYGDYPRTFVTEEGPD